MIRPSHLNRDNADAFLDAEVATQYRYRPTYPDETIRFLDSLVVDKPRRVLDLGAGTGFIARAIAPLVDHVDAVDPSQAMLEAGQDEPGGDDSRIEWIQGTAETVPLSGRYSLIVTGEALHWMNWSIVLPRCASLLTTHGFLAVAAVDELDSPWKAELKDIIASFSVVKDYQPFNLIDALERDGLFERRGEHESQPCAIEQTIPEYIASFHGRSSLARSRMGTSAALQFDRAVEQLVSRYSGDRVTRQVSGKVTYGKPKSVAT